MRTEVVWFGVCCALLTAGYASAIGPRKSTVLTQATEVDATPPIPTVPVAVQNFPLVQSVDGIVAVSNLPAVQTVAGAVAVNNLPLDADGAVRVTSAPSRQMVGYELLDTPSEHVQDYTLPVTVDSTGYSAVGLAVTTDPQGADVVFHVQWQWADDEDFMPIVDRRGGASSPIGNATATCSGHMSGRVVCDNTGGRVQVAVSASPGVVFTSVRVYLFP